MTDMNDINDVNDINNDPLSQMNDINEINDVMDGMDDINNITQSFDLNPQTEEIASSEPNGTDVMVTTQTNMDDSVDDGSEGDNLLGQGLTPHAPPKQLHEMSLEELTSHCMKEAEQCVQKNQYKSFKSSSEVYFIFTFHFP